MRCLIIEVSKSSRSWLGNIVSEAGFAYEEAESGAEALDKCVKTSFDLIFVAMLLNDMDAIHFAELLRAQRHSKHVPLVMIATQESKHLLERAASVGITEVFARQHSIQVKDFVNCFFQRHDIAQRISGHVLYVEDSRPVALKTMMLLEQQGVTIEHVNTAESALQSFYQKDYDLLLTDIILDGQMSGLSLISEIRKAHGNKGRMPILVMTSFCDEARRIELFRAGANDYVHKPALDVELIARVRNQILYKKQLDVNCAQHAQLQTQSMHDALTGIYSRNFFMEVAPARLGEAKRHVLPLALLLIDIDKLDLLNETNGYAAGDIALKIVADVIKSACREEDIVARIGGDEFVILLSNCGAVDAAKKAESIRDRIAQHKTGSIHLTVSLGVSEYRHGVTRTFHDLFQDADQGLLEAKRAGKVNRVALQNSFDHDVSLHENTQLTSILMSAVPVLKNVNVAEGVACFSGNVAAYCGALIDFSVEQVNVIAQIRSAFSKQKCCVAKDMAVNLVVLSKRLGMYMLHDKVRNLISALHRGQTQYVDTLLPEIQLLMQQYCADIQHALTDHKQEQTTVLALSEYDPALLAKLNILIVDDSLVSRMVMEDWLEQLGISFVSVENGAAALDVIMSANDVAWDLIFTDIEMPVMNGYQLAQKIRSLARPISIVAITSHEMTLDNDRQHGFISHLVKPLSKERMLQTILTCYQQVSFMYGRAT